MLQYTYIYIYIHCILYAKLSCLPSKYIYIQWTFSKIHIMGGHLAWLWPSHADGWLQHVAGSLKEVSWIAVSGQPRPSSCSVTERDPTYCIYICILYIYIYTYSVYYIYVCTDIYTLICVSCIYIYIYTAYTRILYELYIYIGIWRVARLAADMTGWGYSPAGHGKTWEAHATFTWSGVFLHYTIWLFNIDPDNNQCLMDLI